MNQQRIIPECSHMTFSVNGKCLFLCVSANVLVNKHTTRLQTVVSLTLFIFSCFTLIFRTEKYSEVLEIVNVIASYKVL